jgi:zinc transport system substrate-binding protein
MKKFIAKVLLVTLLAVALVGHTPNVLADPASKKLNIVATIFPAYDLTRAIVGDKADLTMLLRPGMEIHSFDPSPADIMKVQNADAFLYIGGESDVWVDTLLESMDTSKKAVLRLMDAVSLVEEETVEGMQEEEAEEAAAEEAEYDEHIWTSPKNAILMVNVITDALCAADAQNAAYYQGNAAAYIARIEEVDKEFEAIVQSAPLKLMVFGDRFPFRYFADAYGLEYRAAFPGCSTETECSAIPSPTSSTR